MVLGVPRSHLKLMQTAARAGTILGPPAIHGEAGTNAKGQGRRGRKRSGPGKGSTSVRIYPSARGHRLPARPSRARGTSVLIYRSTLPVDGIGQPLTEASPTCRGRYGDPQAGQQSRIVGEVYGSSALSLCGILDCTQASGCDPMPPGSTAEGQWKAGASFGMPGTSFFSWPKAR